MIHYCYFKQHDAVSNNINKKTVLYDISISNFMHEHTSKNNVYSFKVLVSLL